jgi:hypothetical protein
VTIEMVIKETLNAEANPSYGETVIEAKRSVMNELSPVLWLDEPEPKESLKNYVLECYHCRNSLLYKGSEDDVGLDLEVTG